VRKRERKHIDESPEKLLYSRYYEHDGMLRAYANRAMVLAVIFGTIAMGSLAFAVYVRLQPPTVIRVDKNGEATVVGAHSPKKGVLHLFSASADPETAPTEIEGKAVVRRFLEHYLAYTPSMIETNLAEALNMMTANLRSYSLKRLRDEDTVGKVKQENITASFKLRAIEPVKGQAWSYVAFGVKEVHRVRNKSESTDRIVGRYNVRLVQDRRSEQNPSGLLVAEYSEQQMVGEKDLGLLQESRLTN
jgi:hypothetical protein